MHINPRKVRTPNNFLCAELLPVVHTFVFAELYFVASESKGETLELSVKSPCLWACFHPLDPFSVVSAELGNFIQSQYGMLKLSIYCTRFKTNFNSGTCRRSENICTSGGGAQAKGKTG